MSPTTIQSQRGGTLLGFILGLVIGLTVALGVAMYVTKVPMPFSNKNLSRSAEQDAVEAQKNKDWNPNSAKASNSTDPFTYFVQAGAYKSATDADAQKAKLSMMGIEAKVSEREQAGRIIYRVRSGPFDDKDQAEKIKTRLDSSGMDAALVRVQR